MKKLKYIGVVSVFLFSTFVVAFPGRSEAAYNGGRLIDNNIFLNSNSMSAAQIQSFLASRGSGLATRNFVLQCYGAGSQERQWYTSVGAPCDQNTSAANIIYYASRIYGVNPQVTLATLQKEQSLITTANPTSWQLNQAMGYGCPTTGNCSGNSTFSYQIDSGVWVLRYHYERANGNNSWWSQSSGWVCGTEKNFYKPNLYPRQNVRFYDGNNVHYRTHYIENAATSSFYCYTPHAYNNPQGLYGHPAFGTTGQYYSGSYNFVRFFEAWFGPTSRPLIDYKSHLSGSGWTGTTYNSGPTGTTGQSRTMQALKINGEVEYSSYNINSGWQPTVNRGMISGTTGMNRPIQAIKINPIGSLASSYDLYYRAHVSNVGWMGWAKNGETAGVTGTANQNIEAYEIMLVNKGAATPGSTNNRYNNNGTVSYTPFNSNLKLDVQAHVQDRGWQPTVSDTMVAGTTEQSKRMEAISMAPVNNTGLSGSVTYQVHSSNIGWMGITSAGNIAGTTGQGRQMEAIRIGLTGALNDNYDIFYRTHVSNVGWTGWGKNRQAVGSIGAGQRMEAIETRIVPKNSLSLPSANALHNPRGWTTPDDYRMSYAAHVSNIGWMPAISQNGLAGTTGQSRTLESIRINNINSLYGSLNITCSAYVRNTGWTSDVAAGTQCGTTGQSKPLQSIRLNLSGEAANKYDLSYRVHLSNAGWQNWVINGAQAGTPDGNNIEAVIIRLIPKS